MNDIVSAADHAANQSDRWLFLFVLSVLGVVVLWAARWLLNKHEALMVEHRVDQQTYTTQHRADQQAYTNQLSALTSAVNKTNQELAVVLDRNSTALDENSAELRRGRDMKQG